MNCRLAAYISYTEEFTHQLFSALTLSAKKDPYAKPLGFNSHKDGWGYAVFTLHPRTGIHLYKTSTPIWEDNRKPPLSTSTGILHVRKASSGMPISTAEAHPYISEAGDGTLIFTAQNGGVKKEQLMKILEGYGINIPASSISDTHLLSKLLAALYSREQYRFNLVNVLSASTRIIEEAGAAGRCMNTAVLAVSPSDGAQLAVTRYLYEEADDTLLHYCELYLVKDGPSQAVVSSTLADILSENYSATPLGINTVIPLFPPKK